jgi:hypothetical protein
MRPPRVDPVVLRQSRLQWLMAQQEFDFRGFCGVGQSLTGQFAISRCPFLQTVLLCCHDSVRALTEHPMVFV